MSQQMEKQKKQMEAMKYQHTKEIEKLLEKVGNTTINQTQNIILNNYGNEDLSHITDNLKNELPEVDYFFGTTDIEQLITNITNAHIENFESINIYNSFIKFKKWLLENF